MAFERGRDASSTTFWPDTSGVGFADALGTQRRRTESRTTGVPAHFTPLQPTGVPRRFYRPFLSAGGPGLIPLYGKRYHGC